MRFITLPLQVLIVVLLGYGIDYILPYAPVRWIVGVLQAVSILVLTLRSVYITVPEFINMLRRKSDVKD